MMHGQTGACAIYMSDNRTVNKLNKQVRQDLCLCFHSVRELVGILARYCNCKEAVQTLLSYTVRRSVLLLHIIRPPVSVHPTYVTLVNHQALFPLSCNTRCSEIQQKTSACTMTKLHAVKASCTITTTLYCNTATVPTLYATLVPLQSCTPQRHTTTRHSGTHTRRL